MASLILFGDESSVRAELLHHFLNLVVKAGDEGGDEHDYVNAEDDFKNCQCAAQFVIAQSIHCLLQIFAVCLCHRVLPIRAQGFNRVKLSCAYCGEDSKEESYQG